jgi:hypothetical protein
MDTRAATQPPQPDFTNLVTPQDLEHERQDLEHERQAQMQSYRLTAAEQKRLRRQQRNLKQPTPK